jgi:hypothetical protein
MVVIKMPADDLSYGPSFFTLTTFASRRRGMTLDGAVRAGELTRKVTMPAVSAALLPYSIGVVGSASLLAGPPLSAAARCAVIRSCELYTAGISLAGTQQGQRILNSAPDFVSAHFPGLPFPSNAGYLGSLSSFILSSMGFEVK